MGPSAARCLSPLGALGLAVFWSCAIACDSDDRVAPDVATDTGADDVYIDPGFRDSGQPGPDTTTPDGLEVRGDDTLDVAEDGADFTADTPAPEVIGPTTCTTPWGASVADGASVLAFRDDEVGCATACVSETRTCRDGVLSGTFTAESCFVRPCLACTLPWGASLSHGASLTAYAASQVACGAMCQGELRECRDGALSGTFTAPSCAVAACPPSIVFSTSFGGGAMTSFRTNQTLYGRVLNLRADNTESCAEAVGTPAPNCRSGAPWTRLPNDDWTWDLGASEWRAVFPGNTFPPVTVEVFARNTETGQQTSLVIALTNPCAWSAVVPGPVAPPPTPCTTANANATVDHNGYTWTCVCADP